MAHAKLIRKPTAAVTDYFSTMKQIEAVLKQAGLPGSQTSLLAMHLAEIEEASKRYADLLDSLRADGGHGANGANDSVLDELVEIQVAVEHIVAHAKAVSKLLDKSIDVLDN